MMVLTTNNCGLHFLLKTSGEVVHVTDKLSDMVRYVGKNFKHSLDCGAILFDDSTVYQDERGTVFTNDMLREEYDNCKILQEEYADFCAYLSECMDVNGGTLSICKV